MLSGPSRGQPFRVILSKKVSELMDRRLAVETAVPPTARVSEMRNLIKRLGTRILAVVDNGKLVGIVTRGSLLLVTSSKSEANAKSLAENPKVLLTPDQPVLNAVDNMIKADEWEVPVVNDKDRFAGIFGLGDFLKGLASECKDSLTSLKVEDFMTRDPVSISEEDSVSKIWSKMVELKYAGLPVTDSNGKLVGMITQYDLLSKGYSRIHLESETGASKGPRVRDVMTRGAVFVYPWSSIYDAVLLMVKNGYGRIPVVNSNKDLKLVGIIDREDVARLVVSYGS